MKYGIIGLLMVTVITVPSVVGAVTSEDFEGKTTQNIINLCTVSPSDPMGKEAINFCHGYLLGAYHYYDAEASGPEGEKMVCFPYPPPTRNTVIRMFIEWAKAHPEFMGEKPVETQFRFLAEEWPCKP